MLKAVLRVSAVEGVIAQIASSEVRIRFLGAPILSKQLHTAGGQKISESRGAGGYWHARAHDCFAYPSWFLGITTFGLRCWFPPCVFQRAQQAANPLDALPDAEHLRAEAAVHGQDWLHAELDGSMKLDKLRAFAAGLGVQQRDPASGSRLSKSQLLEAVVAALRSRPDTEAWFRSYK